MDHVLSVRIVECRGDLLGKMERIIDWELLLAVQPLAQRLAGDERHDIVEEPVGLARVEQWKDVRVFEAGGELDLAQEPLAADRSGQLGFKNLDRHLAVELAILGEIHDGHPPTTQFPLDPVTVGEGDLQAIELLRRVRHGVAAPARNSSKMGRRGRTSERGTARRPNGADALPVRGLSVRKSAYARYRT